MAGQEIEKALLAENQRRIIERLTAIEHHLKPKTDAEQIAIIKNTSTPEQWAKIVDERIEVASFDEIFETLAAAEGKTVDQYLNPGKYVMLEAQTHLAIAKMRDEEMRRAEKKQQLFEEADAL